MKDSITWKIAHRGWHQQHIENTLEAFRAAYSMGCDMVEFDVQISKDGIPFIFHDDDFLRLAGRPEKTFDLTWNEIQKIKMHSTQNNIYSIPSLAEFLKEFGEKPYYLELKIPDQKGSDPEYFCLLARRVIELIQDQNSYQKQIPPSDQSFNKTIQPTIHPNTFLASFHREILQWIAKEKLFPPSNLGGIFETYENFIEVFSKEDEETAKAIHYYSVSWEIFDRWTKEANKNTLLNKALLNNFLIWNITGEKQFQQAFKFFPAGLVTDDAETLLR